MTTKSKKTKPETENISVRLPKKTVEYLDQIAKQQDRSRNWVLNDALSGYVEHNSWITRHFEKRHKQAMDPNTQWIPHEQVMKEGLERLKKKLGL